MLGSIKVLIRKILMTLRVSRVTYTKNRYFRSRPYGRAFVPVDTDSVIHKLQYCLYCNIDGAHEVYTERLEHTILHYVFPVSDLSHL